MQLPLISTVDHIVEHPTVWTQRLSCSKWSDRVPHLEHQGDRTDAWIIDGRKVLLSEGSQVGALMDDRVDSPKRWKDMPKAAYAPAERLKAMDKDGVDYSVLYPSFAGFSGENLGAISDPELALACIQAYNDWLFDEWGSFSDRFIPLCLLPLCPIDAAVRELERCNKRGYRGAVFPAVPMHVRPVPHINGADYDALWASFQELDIPLCFHAGSSRMLQYPIAPNYPFELAAAMQAVIRPASAVFDFVNVLFSRILLRFPKLKVVFAESTIGWGTFILEYADHQYEQDHCDYELKPSEMFKRQCYLSAWYDSVELDSQYVGPNNILWATNFPNANSTWPDTRTFISKCLAGVSDYQRDQILWENAAKLYNIENAKSVARMNPSLGRV